MNTGFGVMVHQLSGGSDRSASDYYGRKITAIELKDDDVNTLNITFEDGVEIIISDQGQSCCEQRYMRTDDDPEHLVGGILTDVSLKYAEEKTEEEEDDWEETHEICFLELVTTRGSMIFANHNEHNGYYGGFAMDISEKERATVVGNTL